MLRMSVEMPANANEEVLDATRKPLTLPRAVSSSSASPLQKYSMSWSGPKFSKGRTAIDGV
jgi:hypothetical protein